jgi:hypothetical protein
MARERRNSEAGGGRRTAARACWGRGWTARLEWSVAGFRRRRGESSPLVFL